MQSNTTTLSPHQLSIALLQPQIAPNTGNIGRLCVATGTRLHLVRPFGFILSDRELRRSGMDYWDRLDLTLQDDTTTFFAFLAENKIPFWLFSTKADKSYWDMTCTPGDCLVFGSETSGIDAAILRAYPERVVRIPQVAEERCLNLSTAAGIGLYEALRQIPRK